MQIKAEVQCKDKKPLRAPREAHTEPPVQQEPGEENSWWDWVMGEHKNSREKRGKEGKESEDFRKLVPIKAKNIDSIKLCWWCKDSLISMAKVAS